MWLVSGEPVEWPGEAFEFRAPRRPAEWSVSSTEH